MAGNPLRPLYERLERFGPVIHFAAGFAAGFALWLGPPGWFYALLGAFAFDAYQVHDDNRPVWEYAEWLAGLTAGFLAGLGFPVRTC